MSGEPFYRFSSGTPTYLIEMLKIFHVMPSEIGEGDADKSEFEASTENITSIIPLLYQSGYVTIKGYDPETELYTFNLPNKEIRVVFIAACCQTTLARTQ